MCGTVLLVIILTLSMNYLLYFFLFSYCFAKHQTSVSSKATNFFRTNQVIRRRHRYANQQKGLSYSVFEAQNVIKQYAYHNCTETRSVLATVIIRPVKLIHVLQLEEGHNSLLHAMQARDTEHKGEITKADLRFALTRFGIPIKAIDMEHFLVR